MALQGVFASSKNTSAGAGFPSYVYVEWSASQDAILNRSMITWTCKVGSDYDNDKWVAIGPTTVTINGTATTIERKQGYKVTNKDCVLGSGTVVVDHGADGTKTAAVSLSSAIYSSSQNVSYSGNIILDPIDRTPPVVTFDVSGITVDGVTLSAASTSVCDIWYYTTQNGAIWTQFSTTAGTTASISLTGLLPAQDYILAIKARKASNAVEAISAVKIIKTLGGAVITDVTALMADFPMPSFDISLRVYQAYPVDVVVSHEDTTLIERTGLTVSAGTTDLTITPTAQELNAIFTATPNDKEIAATLSVISMDGETAIQTSTASLPIKITQSSAPSLAGWTFEQTDPTIVTLLGNSTTFVQSYSIFEAVITESGGVHGASVVNRTLQIGDKIAQFNSGGVASMTDLDVSGTVAAIVTITDSRGYTTSLSKNVTFLPWKPVRVNVTTLRRANGVDADIQLAFDGTLSALTVGGTQKNHVTAARYRVKETSASTWGAWTSIMSGITENGENFSFSEMELTTLDPKKSYNFQLEVDDELSGDISEQYSETFVIAQGKPIIEIVKGKVVINGDVEINGDLVVNGTITQNTPSTDHTMTISGNGSSSYCYVVDADTSTAYYANGDTFTVADGNSIVCYVSNMQRRVTVDGVSQTLTNNAFTYIPTSDCTIALSFTVADHSYIDITTN